MKLSYEDACAIHPTIVTVDNFKSIGVPKTMELYKQALSDAGWTLELLCEDSRNRMLAKLNTK